MSTYGSRFALPLLDVAAVRDLSGETVPALVPLTDAGVTVRVVGSTSPAPVFTNRSMATPLANPLPTGVAANSPGVDTFGNLVFWAPAGDENGSTTYEVLVVVDGEDPVVFVLPTLATDAVEPVALDRLEEAVALPADVAALAEATTTALAGKQATIPPGTFVQTTGESAVVGGIDITGAEDGDIPFSLSATAPDGDQTVTVRFSAVPNTGGAQGFIFDCTNHDRPLGFVWETDGVPVGAIARDAGTNDMIWLWSPTVPGDQFRGREGGHILLGRSVGHPTEEYRLRLDSVVGDPAAMADLLYLGVNTAAPTLRALRITNETNTLLSVKADNSGVGIGTLTPGAQLHVVHSQDATTQFLLANGNNTASAKASTRVQSASGSLFLESYPALFTTTALAGHSFIYTTGSADLILGTAGTDRIHVAANGRVGMGGVTVPAAWLDINAPTDLALLRLQMAAAQAANPFVIVDSAAAAVFAISSAGRMFAFTGSAASAGIGFLGDPNTGLFSNVADTLQFTAGGTERARISTAALQLSEAINLVVGTTTGSKLGTATTQKLGFWNATPVVQPAGIADVAGGATVDAEARAAINSLLGKLETIGLLAAA